MQLDAFCVDLRARKIGEWAKRKKNVPDCREP
jgi:hypothetical protein